MARRRHRPSSTGNPSSSSPRSAGDRRAPSSTADDVPPFFDTSFSAHRVSPLHVGADALDPARLALLSRRLRDSLVGDVVRGVQVGLEGGGDAASLGRAGALELVALRWVGVAALLGGTATEGVDLDDSVADVEGDEDALLRGKKSLCIEIRYEHALCTALLLPPFSEDDPSSRRRITAWTDFDVPPPPRRTSAAASDRFLDLPLLLLRMPAPLKSFIADFLATTFDCRVTALHLGTRPLVDCWERWIDDAGLPSKGPLARDVVLTLGFYVPAAPSAEGDADSADAAATNPAREGEAESLGIKSVDVIIPAAELSNFARVGRDLQAEPRPGAPDVTKRRTSALDGLDGSKRRRLAGGSADEGWAWRRAEARPGDDGAETAHPFTEALGRYVERHLALDMFHPGVRITKIACGGFALSEGRVKLFAPPAATEGKVARPVRRFVARLVDQARGNGLDATIRFGAGVD